MNDERFWNIWQKEVTEAAHIEQTFTHYESQTEDYLQCQREYEDGMWGV